ncbi:pseudouridine synthase [Liquorilactobacillus vini]|uniref:Pseudouridine synthase n=1 Tax=Liquorilactobacillus vini DSM 20605 TaxID=1133569 RepID=A0A0R2CPI7_9LACO|nr:pseudouridine synthase [Liquorilactobacillus vini]KRM89699.1 ribosomal large subunit pseudouridine synthase B [Liquorilactobacillus vini DSM 20605]
MTKERLQKVIAQAGIASRRAAEKLIMAGKVRVNGNVVTELGTKVTTADLIQVNGRAIEQQKKDYYLFYKPRGVISAVSDNKGRKVVTDYFSAVKERIYPIGRLDYDTSGILLLTNDGDLANHLMHPRFKIEKTYLAKVEGIPSNEELKKLSRGVLIDGKKTSPAKVKKFSINLSKQTSLWLLTIHEGRNHQVKKMFAAIGHPVIKLKRQNYSFLDLAGLMPGQYRQLSHQEVEQLKKLVK